MLQFLSDSLNSQWIPVPFRENSITSYTIGFTGLMRSINTLNSIENKMVDEEHSILLYWRDRTMVVYENISLEA